MHSTQANQKAEAKLIVLTGGPCAGKSTVLRHLQERYGVKASYIPETATDLLSSGFPPLATAPDEAAWKRAFQETMLSTQLQREEAALLAAQQLKQDVVFCDRGLADSIAYHPEGLEGVLNTNFAQSQKWNSLSNLHNRYAVVFCLESVAIHWPEKFERASNTIRYESSIDMARDTDRRTQTAWRCHDNFTFICNQTRSLSDVISAVTTITDQLVMPA